MTQSQQHAVAVRHSRIGKRPVPVPAGVTVVTKDGVVTVKGPKGESKKAVPAGVVVSLKDGNAHFQPTADANETFSRMQGLLRALVKNMIEGVSKGYVISMDLHGVGYRAEIAGKTLTLALGFSHPVTMPLPDGVTAKVEIIDEAGQKRPRLHLSSHDKELIGQTAARIRSFRPPEPYKGKGVRYLGEKVREKAGKAAAKGKK